MTLPFPRKRRSTIAAGALLLSILGASPALADSQRAREMRTDRGAAERTLDRATALARGTSSADGRELTPELAGLAARLPALAPAEREAAEDLLARPTNPAQTGQPGGPYTVPSSSGYTAPFCFHWVNSTEDAPPPADANGNGAPDYIERMADVFEHVYGKENGVSTEGGLWWREPISDGALGGCTDDGWEGRTDVYVKDIGKLGLY